VAIGKRKEGGTTKFVGKRPVREFVKEEKISKREKLTKGVTRCDSLSHREQSESEKKRETYQSRMNHSKKGSR